MQLARQRDKGRARSDGRRKLIAISLGRILMAIHGAVNGEGWEAEAGGKNGDDDNSNIDDNENNADDDAEVHLQQNSMNAELIIQNSRSSLVAWWGMVW